MQFDVTKESREFDCGCHHETFIQPQAACDRNGVRLAGAALICLRVVNGWPPALDTGWAYIALARRGRSAQGVLAKHPGGFWLPPRAAGS